MRALIVSYVPFMPHGDESTASIDQDQATLDRIQRQMNLGSEYGMARGAFWMVNGEQATCAIVIDRAAELIEHMKVWSENRLEKWFTFQVRADAKNKQYSFFIMPNLLRSADRWKINYQLKTGYPPPKDTKADIVFIPIYFFAKESKLAEHVAKMPGKDVELLFVDTNNAEAYLKNPDSSSLSHSFGKFRVEANDNIPFE